MTDKRKIIPPRETIEFEVGTITLMPAKFEHFSSITEIANKYFSTFNNAVNEYAEKRAKVIAEHEDESMRQDAVTAFDSDTDVGYDIAQAIFKAGAEAADDARAMIQACIDDSKENPINLTKLTVVEIMILLGVCIGLNINFFNQNQDIMGLKTILRTEEKASDPASPIDARERARKKKTNKSGTKSLPDS